MKNTYNQEVSERLVSFGQALFGSEFGWQTKFAKALDMSPQGLQPYLNAVRLPGNTILARLNKLGCSSDWLLYGETKEAESISIPLMNIPIYSFLEGVSKGAVMEKVVSIILNRIIHLLRGGLILGGNIRSFY